MTDGPDASGPTRRRWLRFANSRLVRMLITAAVGTALFVLGVAYLNLGRQPDVPTVMVIGGTHLQAGTTGALRVRGRMADAKTSVPVAVDSAGSEGVLLEAVDGDDPAIVRLRVAEDAPRVADLALDVTAGDRTVPVVLELPTTRGRSRLGLPESVPPLPETRFVHRVDVLPEAGELAANMDNTVFLRVRDVAGAPVATASIEVRHAALADGGTFRCTTDGSGLCAMPLVAKQPSFRLGITVRHGEAETKTDALLRPHGRRMLLQADAPVVAPGAAVRARLDTWEASTDAWCDLLSGGAWIDSRRVRSDRGHADIDLGPLPPGRYSLQCYAHDIAPGETFATQPLLVDEGDPLTTLTRVAQAEGLAHPAGATVPPGTDAALALGYWQAVLRGAPRPPEVLASTRAAALAERDDVHSRAKTKLLVAIVAVILLVLLWVADSILKNILETRDRMRRYAIEALHDGDDVDVDAIGGATFGQRTTLVRTRGVLLLFVVGGAIILNVVGLLALFAMIR